LYCNLEVDNIIDLKEIKPKVKGESDKYSWNLYNFLNSLFKKRENGKYYKKQLEICWLHHSRFDGKWLDFNPDKLNIMQLIIVPLGVENGRSFYSLSSILREGKAVEFAIPWKKEGLTNITEWFFDTYEKDGRCIFDRNHNSWLLGSDNRFTYVNNTRKCNWCGEWYKKEIVKEVKIKRREIWV
jgi:hypothetical protein